MSVMAVSQALRIFVDKKQETIENDDNDEFVQGTSDRHEKRETMWHS